MRPRNRPRTMTRPLVAAVALAGVMVLVVGGCGSGDDGGDDDRNGVGEAVTTVVDESPVDTVEWVDDVPDAAEAEILVGLRVDDAEALAADEGWEVRVAVLDGEELFLTMDYVATRVNVEVTDGIVTGIVNFG